MKISPEEWVDCIGPEGQREMAWIHWRQTLGILPSKPLPYGDTQINRNGLNQDVRLFWGSRLLGRISSPLFATNCEVVRGLK